MSISGVSAVTVTCVVAVPISSCRSICLTSPVWSLIAFRSTGRKPFALTVRL